MPEPGTMHYAPEKLRICRMNLRKGQATLSLARKNGFSRDTLALLEFFFGALLDELWEAQEDLKAARRHWA